MVRGALAIGVCTFAASAYLLAQEAPTEVRFDVASVRANTSGSNIASSQRTPGRMAYGNTILEIVLLNAFTIQRHQLVEVPDWVNTDRYDIEATASDGKATDPAKMRLLLEDRFKMKFHRETRDVPAFSLVVAGKPGPGLTQESKESCIPQEQRSTATGRFVLCGAVRMGTDRVSGAQITMKSLAAGLAFVLSQPVIDNTGLEGTFDVQLRFVSEADILANRNESNGPGIMTAIQEQLGLRLAPTKTPAEVVVIDHIERPSAN